MSIGIPETWSIEAATEYVWGVQAGLAADDKVEALVSAWDDMEAQLEAERTARNRARKAAIRASAVQRVADANWDSTLGGAGDWAFMASARNPKAPPYATVFDLVSPSVAKQFGAAKAVGFGSRVVSRLRTLQVPGAAEQANRVEQASAALSTAAADRVRLSLEAQTHDIRRRALLAALEDLVDQTEIAILTAYPGQRARVQAILRVRKDASGIDRDAPEGGGNPEEPPSE
jgi:hypothetical protein